MNVTPSLMPHAVCWAAAPRLVWTMVVANFVTFASYVCICGTLLFIARRTLHVMAREWIFFVVGFALFIVACGSTHLMDVITTWIPVFWIDAWSVIVTALLSAYVAVNLIRRAPAVAFSIDDYATRLANTENEKRQMEESLLAAQKLEDWSRMSAVISHEIGNPLETIHNLLFLIRTTEGVSPEVVELSAAAATEATRVLTIARSTLSVFRQSAQPELIDLHAEAESVRFLLDPCVAKHHVRVTIEYSGDVTVQALPGETRQVLLNLVRNACEASTIPDASVDVKITGHKAGVEMIIADHGVGIDPAVLPQLFQFGRSTKGDKGNGLGLWTVKHILDKHHGDITVNSTPGEGTSFCVWWPRTFTPAEQPGPSATAA